MRDHRKQLFWCIILGAIVVGGAIFASSSNEEASDIVDIENAIIIKGITINSSDPISEEDTDNELKELDKLNKLNKLDKLNGKILYDNSFDEILIQKSNKKSSNSSKSEKVESKKESKNDFISNLKKTDSKYHVIGYTLKDGDNLWKIAKNNNCLHTDIIKLNNIKNADLLTTGKTILIPSRKGIYHTVQKGDTVTSLVKTYNVDKKLLLEANKIQGSNIKIGQKLFLPSVNQVNSIASVNKKQTKNDNNDNYIENVKIISQNYAKIKKTGSEPSKEPIKKTQTGATGSELKVADSRNPVKNKPRRELEYIIQSSKENESDTGSEPNTAGDEIAADNTPAAEKVKSIAFVWPIEGRISSGFGVRRDPFSKSKKIQTQFHSGIDISTNEGTPIKASESGIVVFSGWKDGYGNLVMIRHKLGYFTVYAHNSKNLCSVNDYVEQNDIIAHSGSTGNVTGPHLHFEIRKYLTPLNPIRMIR